MAEWTHAKSAVGHHRTYLGTAVRQLGDRVSPPPPDVALAAADRQVFRETRALQGSPRWKQAANDTDQSAPALLKAFSCASGLNLTAKRAPHLAALLDTAGTDGSHIASRAKSKFRRARPYLLDRGATCRTTQGLGDFHDYPSGHSSRGWTWALVLAELLPDRREQLLSRANAYAESRVICGFHSPTGAKAGRSVATLTVDSLMRNPSFRADMRQAARELAVLKQEGEVPAARRCQSDRIMLDSASARVSTTAPAGS